MRVLLGTTERDGSTVELAASSRMRHAAMFGKSGVGKTTLLKNMIVADLCSGVGLTVIDPHGGLIDELLSLLPRSRTNDVIYINPADRERPLGINILESVNPHEKHLVVSSVKSVIKHTWPDFWGPRLEWILEHAVAALLDSAEPATLLGLPKLLTNSAYRGRILKSVSDPALIDFFRLYDAQNERVRDEWIAPVLNKVARFLTNPLLRVVLGQARSSFDFRWAMDNNKIILVNLAKGLLGEDVSSLLGSLVTSKLALTSLSRQDVPEDERVPHLLYIDEAGSFTAGIDLPTILAESRKFRLGLCLSTQSIVQYPEATAAAVFANVGSLIAFRVSHDDALALVRYFGVSGEGRITAEEAYSFVPASELQALADRKFFFQTLKSGAPHEPIRVDALPPLGPRDMRKIWNTRRIASRERVLRLSAERYGRGRQAVEAEIIRFLAA
jgi:hypothetical protein